MNDTRSTHEDTVGTSCNI